MTASPSRQQKEKTPTFKDRGVSVLGCWKGLWYTYTQSRIHKLVESSQKASLGAYHARLPAGVGSNSSSFPGLPSFDGLWSRKLAPPGSSSSQQRLCCSVKACYMRASSISKLLEFPRFLVCITWCLLVGCKLLDHLLCLWHADLF